MCYSARLTRFKPISERSVREKRVATHPEHRGYAGIKRLHTPRTGVTPVFEQQQHLHIERASWKRRRNWKHFERQQLRVPREKKKKEVTRESFESRRSTEQQNQENTQRRQSTQASLNTELRLQNIGTKLHISWKGHRSECCPSRNSGVCASQYTRGERPGG